MIISFTSGNTNCYVLKSENETILIDCGIASDRNFIKKLSKITDISKIDMLVLTHGHYDHVGNAWLLQQKYGVKIAMHKCDIPKVENGSMDFPESNNIFGTLIKNLFSFRINSKLYHSFKPDIIIEGQYMEFSRPNFAAVHLPGHTSGSIGIVWNKNFFVGDLFMNMGIVSKSLFAENFYKLEQSISYIKKIKGVKKYYLGHGRECSFEDIQKINIDFINKNASQLIGLVK